MLNNDEQTLIDAIHADPKNDAPRLAYADWLARHDEPEHAELIRLQCQEPYVAISNRDPDHPIPSFSFVFPHDDPTARDRRARLLELLPLIYRTDRYSVHRKLPYYEEHYRGLPLIHVGDEDETDIGDWVLEEMGPLSRVDLCICTDRLAEILSHPIMARLDKLHIWPQLPGRRCATRIAP